MAQYGITDKGFVLKRLDTILQEQRQKAVELFQDLVDPGDIVDTSDSSLLGRLISLDSVGDSELWETMQEVYLSFDPNSSMGIPLDNLVALSGIERFGDSATTSPVVLAGDLNTTILAGSEVGSSSTGKAFTLTQLVQLSTNNASGVTVVVGSVQNNTLYTLQYATQATTQTVNYTSDSDATVLEILNGLSGVIAASHPSLVASVVGSTLVVNTADVFQSVTFTVTSNLTVSKVKKVADVICTELGAVVQGVGTINKINTPLLGWDSVTNPVSATVGRVAETDAELRLRFRNSKNIRSSNTLEAIYSALNDVTGVEEFIIYENFTDVVDSNGVLPHSFLPIVSGGLASDIAQAIWDNKPLGIRSQGNTIITVTDSQGFPHDIGIERPNQVVIYITLDLTANGSYPGNGDDLIKDFLIQYFQDNYGIGDNVIHSRLYTPVNSVPGHEVNSLYIGTSPSPTLENNIPISFNEIASLSDVNIVITKT